MHAIAYGAVNTCIPSADTLIHTPGGKVVEAIPDRKEYLRGQTPQAFRYDWILQAHENALAQGIKEASDDCQLVLRMGRPIYLIPGDEKNIKITSKFDLFIAEQWLSLASFV